MTEFIIKLDQVSGENPDGIISLSMRYGESIFTSVLRGIEHATTMLVPIAPLALWFAQNWWRLRWETAPTSAPDSWSDNWRMAHEMNAIGAGHVWPRLTIWGDKNRTRFVARADAFGIAGPVRLLNDALAYAPAAQFEQEVDRFFEHAGNLIPVGRERSEFIELIEILRQERADPAITQWRRLEAVSGYSPDEAPESMVERLCALESEYGADDVEEAVAATPGPNAASILDSVLDMVTTAPGANFAEIIKLSGYCRIQESSQSPWIQAELAAKRVRQAAGISQTDAVLNYPLSHMCQVSRDIFASDQQRSSNPPYAICVRQNYATVRVLLNARYSHDKRFQLARALGDNAWHSASSISPLTNTLSARQQFQRAFAAALLCPEDGLREFLNPTDISDEDISEAARRFHVNEKTVRTVMVNKGMLRRDRLSPFQYEDTGDDMGVSAEVA